MVDAVWMQRTIFSFVSIVSPKVVLEGHNNVLKGQRLMLNDICLTYEWNLFLAVWMKSISHRSF